MSDDGGRTTDDALPAPVSAIRPLSSVLCPLNASRFSEARLQAVSSRNMYSEHGLDAMIGPEAGQVCQSLMEVWNCRPGSADAQAAKPIFSHRSRALMVLATRPGLVRQVRSQLASDSTALRN